MAAPRGSPAPYQAAHPAGYPAADSAPYPAPYPAAPAATELAVAGTWAQGPVRVPEEVLIEYLGQCYVNDSEISLDGIRGLLARCRGRPVDWSLRSKQGDTALHLAAINEATPPTVIPAVICELIRYGAPLDARDNDGKTPMDAVMALAEESAEDDGYDKEAHIAAVRALMTCPAFSLDSDRIWKLAAWLRRNFPAKYHQVFLADLMTKAGPAGKDDVERAWCTEQMMQYLEDCAYETTSGVRAALVREFLSRGATPGQKNNGEANALLLVVLNSYSTVEELQEVFSLLLKADPRMAIERDELGRNPLHWAVDYTNVSSQDGHEPNPAALLALLPALISHVPAELDAGEVCFKVSKSGFCTSNPSGTSLPPPPRFLEGDRVKCRVDAPGMACVWEEGVVVGLWYREPCWPEEFPGAPYEVRLDLGNLVFALVDDDRIVRPERAASRNRPSMRSSRATKKPQASRGAAAPAKGGRRFQKRQREDAEWELLDTVSGKARPSSPPDSDEDD